MMAAEPPLNALSPDGPGACLLVVRAHPKSARDGIEGWVDDADGRPALKVRVAAPPNDGAANAAILKVLAKALGLPKSALRIASGETARIKRIRIDAPMDEMCAQLQKLTNSCS